MAYSLDYSDEARGHLHAILSARFEATSSYQAVDDWLSHFEDSIGVLGTFPRYGRKSDNARLDSMGYRKLTVGSYVVFYTVDDCMERVRLEGIFHHRQDYEGRI